MGGPSIQEALPIRLWARSDCEQAKWLAGQQTLRVSLILRPVLLFLLTAQPLLAVEPAVSPARQFLNDPDAYEARIAHNSLEFLKETIGAEISDNPFSPETARYFQERAGAEMWRRYVFEREATSLDPYWDHPVEAPLIRNRSLRSDVKALPVHLHGMRALTEGEFLWTAVIATAPLPAASVYLFAPAGASDAARSALLAEALGGYIDPTGPHRDVERCVKRSFTVAFLRDGEVAQWRQAADAMNQSAPFLSSESGDGYSVEFMLGTTGTIAHYQMKIDGGMLAAREVMDPWQAAVRHITWPYYLGAVSRALVIDEV